MLAILSRRGLAMVGGRQGGDIGGCLVAAQWPTK